MINNVDLEALIEIINDDRIKDIKLAKAINSLISELLYLRKIVEKAKDLDSDFLLN